MNLRHDIEIGPPAGEAELRAFCRIGSQALFFPAAEIDAWIGREGPQNVRVARRQGSVAGGLTIQRMGVFFGGKSVPMAGVRMVSVAPEHRSAGVGSELIRAAMAEFHREGVPVSILYPATQPVYRRQGYEQAGVRMRYRLSVRVLEVRDRSLDVRAIEKSDWPHVRKVYTERAQRTSGNLDRTDWMWARILDPPPWADPVYGYLAIRGGRVEGYVVFSHKVLDASEHDHELQIVDFVALTADAGRRVMTLLADHRSVAEHVQWCGAPADPVLLLLTEQRFKITDRLDWMLRLVDVRAALEARGYPAGVSAELHLDVADDVLAHNHGRIVVRIADSRATVAEGGRGDLRIDVRGLAALYTGHLAPSELKSTGYLEGPEHAVNDAGAVFAGPAPWMPDIF